MSTSETPAEKKQARWIMPATGVVLGAIAFGASAARGEWIVGILMAAIIIGYVVVVAVRARRNEASALLAGTADDERQQTISLKAGSITSQVLSVVLVCGFLWAIGTGSSAAAIWAGLCAVGGFTYIGSTVILSRTT
ncbi:hypothetical protein [Tsukamurella sp. PLM1]|uniref:hypothetical protein n=1 Tax=Tsukamurella sp. PLM1 TaxID=2929795 RepID=UPI00205B9CA7|nr:hypothetical protein [Tsukamurella sp. PLM1]BDH55330.1 hypothetical protein MTP03_02690 [Tsukamurella sp. PLM1]